MLVGDSKDHYFLSRFMIDSTIGEKASQTLDYETGNQLSLKVWHSGGQTHFGTREPLVSGGSLASARVV